MKKYYYYRTIKDIRKELEYSPSYRVEKITQLMGIGKEVWIKYYAFYGIDNASINIDGGEKYVGAPSVMLYVLNKNKSSKVYIYNGILSIQRLTKNKIRQDIILNIDEIILSFQKYLRGNKKRK